MERFAAGRLGTNAPNAAISIRDAAGFVWASGLVANAPFSVSNAPNALLALSTFDFRVDGTVSFLSCTNADLSGVLVLNREGDEGVSSDGQISVSSGSDFWPLARSDGLGRNVDPLVDGTLHPVSSASPLYTAADHVPGVWTDLDGMLRHVVHPCVGAFEYLVETSTPDGGGRERDRTIAGIVDERGYDYYGRLVSFTDGETGVASTYDYDFAGRRVRKQVGSAVTTMFYEWGGNDVVVEIHDEDGDGALVGRGDYTRHYWNEPGIDRRIGFSDKYGDGTTARFWYVTGPNGTVYAILDDNGRVVNRYEYDSFGVIDWRHSFEKVPNRYTFQGREFDAERGDYYYRARTYDPFRGTFLGPDMNLAAGPFGEPNGMMSYVFCGNDPWTFRDPEGLWWTSEEWLAAAEGFCYGLKGGASILANTITFGATDYIGLTDSTQYSDSTFDVTRVCATITREAFVTAGTMAAGTIIEGGRGVIATAKAVKIAGETRDLVLSAEQAIDGAQEIKDGHYVKGTFDLAAGLVGVHGAGAELSAVTKSTKVGAKAGKAVSGSMESHAVALPSGGQNGTKGLRACASGATTKAEKAREIIQRNHATGVRGEYHAKLKLGSEYHYHGTISKEFRDGFRRRPDFVRYDHLSGLPIEIVEVKNVSHLDISPQLTEMIAFAKNKRNMTFKLIIDERTVITEGLQQLLVSGDVSVERILLQY